MTKVTYTKLKNGTWGVWVRGDDRPSPGQTVTVTKKSGEKVDEVVDEVLSTVGSNVYICSIRYKQELKPGSVGGSMPFVLPEREIYTLVSPKGQFSEHKLTDVAKRLSLVRDLQQPTDHRQPLSGLHVDFTQGFMNAGWTDNPERIYLVSSNAAGQMARQVLPSRFFPGLRQLAKMDRVGADLASRTWNKFASTQRSPSLVRTTRAKVEGKIHWVIRSCQSTKYAPYDNLELVTDIMENAQEFASMPVISCHVTDYGMRVRFYAIEQTLATFMHFDKDALLNEPIPMIEMWNSEVGRRRVGFRAGLYRVVSATGLTCWSDRQEISWTHRGRSKRIVDGVRSSFADLVATARVVIKVYKRAIEVPVDDPEEYLVAVAEKYKIGPSHLKSCKVALADPTTTPGGTLASVVDAIALAASNLEGWGGEDLERIASTVMEAGVRKYDTTLAELKAEEV